MTDQNAPVVKHLVSAKEHLAGIAAHQAWVKDLAAQGLLDSQQPIKRQPIEPTQEPAP